MIQITVPKSEYYDQAKEIFYSVDKPVTIQLEHSLISLQKWESKWNKPFLVKTEKTAEESIDYLRCMCLTPNVKDDVFYCIPPSEMTRLSEYIDSPMTATTFAEDKIPGGGGKGKKQIVTAELIYYWMISYNIPSEYRKWHLNQLITLIRVFNEENKPKKKKSRNQLLAEHRALNEANKLRYHTHG